MLTLDHFAYQHLIRHYQAVFGAANVHVFCYEAFRRDPRAFMESFARRLDLELDWERIDFRPSNDGFGRVSLELARALSPFTRWDSPERPRLLPVVPKKVTKTCLSGFNKSPLAGPRPSNRSLFGEALYRELHDRFAADNQDLAQLTGLPLGEHGYPMTPLSDATPEGRERDRTLDRAPAPSR